MGSMQIGSAKCQAIALGIDRQAGGGVFEWGGVYLQAGSLQRRTNPLNRSGTNRNAEGPTSMLSGPHISIGIAYPTWKNSPSLLPLTTQTRDTWRLGSVSLSTLISSSLNGDPALSMSKRGSGLSSAVRFGIPALSSGFSA